MNVGQLKAALEQFPDDLEILTAADPEGNAYYRLRYRPGVFYINKSEAGAFMIESVVDEDELTDDEDEADWDLTYRGDVEPRLIIG